MKRNKPLFGVTYFIVLIVGLSGLFSCEGEPFWDQFGDTLCGAKMDAAVSWHNPGNGSINTELNFRTYIKEGNRYYQFSTDIIEDVCPDKHVEVYLHTILNLEQSVTIHTKCFGRFGLFEPPIPLTETDPSVFNVSYVHEGDFGLKQAYGDDPARFEVYLEYYFVSFGDEAEDWDYFIEKLGLFALDITWYEYDEG